MLAAPLVLTTRSGAGRLGSPAIGLAPWTSHPSSWFALASTVAPGTACSRPCRALARILVSPVS
jgi:hypothetical protein